MLPDRNDDHGRQPAKILDFLPPRAMLAAFRRAVGADFGHLESSPEVFIAAARTAAGYDPDVQARLEEVANDILHRVEAAGGDIEDLTIAYASGVVIYDRADERLAAAVALEAAWPGSTGPHDHSRDFHVRALRKRAKRARRILDAALGTGGRLAVSDDALDAWRHRRRAMAASLVEAYGVADVDAVLTIQDRQHKATIAAHFVKGQALREIALDAGLECRLVTLTAPGHLHGRPFAAKDAVEGIWRKLRAALWKVAAEEVVADFDTRAAAWEHARDLRADNTDRFVKFVVPPKKRNGRWVVVRRHLVGRLTMGVVNHDPHRDGTPHIHAALYVHPAALEALEAILERLAPAPQGDLVEITDDEGEAIDYCMKHLFAEGDNADRVRCWAQEMGVRTLAFVGLNALTTVWQHIYTAAEDDLTIDRARLAKEAMRRRDWTTAARVLGMVRTDRLPPLRLVYETATADHGREVKRLVGIVDPTTGETMSVGPRSVGASLNEEMEDIETVEVDLVTVPANRPRGPAEPPDPDPDDWLEAAD